MLQCEVILTKCSLLGLGFRALRALSFRATFRLEVCFATQGLRDWGFQHPEGGFWVLGGTLRCRFRTCRAACDVSRCGVFAEDNG